MDLFYTRVELFFNGPVKLDVLVKTGFNVALTRTIYAPVKRRGYVI